MTESEKWTTACWEWPLPDLRHLQGKDPLEVEDEAYRALRDWQDGRCAMCGGDNESLVDDHDHRTALIRGLLCAPCNKLEGWQQSKDKPFEGYRQKSPAIMLGLTIRYFDHFNGRYAEPVDEAFEADLMRRAHEAAMKIGFDLGVKGEDE